MDQVFQALIDRSRVLLDLKTIKTILGYKHRPKYRQRKMKSAEWGVAVEKPTYDLTVFKLHCGRLTLRIYTKGERVLSHRDRRPQYRGTPVWTFAGEVSRDRAAGEEHSGALHGNSELRRSVLHRRSEAEETPGQEDRPVDRPDAQI